MNLMRQREDMKEAHKVGCISEWQLEMALASPVFQWYAGSRTMGDEESEWLFTNVMEKYKVMLGKGAVKRDQDVQPSHDLRDEGLTEGEIIWPRIVPYECFRISYLDSPIYEQWFIGKERILCFRCDDHYSHKDVKMWSVHSNRKGEGFWKLWVYLNGQKLDLHGKTKK